MESQIAPGFLVAAPQLKDPNFERTVILMLEHDDDQGSIGLVVNRSAGVDLSMVLDEMQLNVPVSIETKSQPPILYGGPVTPERGWILHTKDWEGPETREVVEGLMLTTSPDILEAIVSNQGPGSYRFCLGYAGWGPHQLVSEIKTGSWLIVPYSQDLIFNVPLDERWAGAIGILGIDPSQLVGMVGDA